MKESKMDTLGITVFMTLCSFEVEIDRSTIQDTLKDIDATLDMEGIDKDPEERILMITENCALLSLALIKQEMNFDVVINELAFSFIYMYSKNGGEILDTTRGFIASLGEEHINYWICDNDENYKKNVSKSKEIYKQFMGDDMEDRTPPRPTIH